MLSVEDIMTREPYTLGPDDTLLDAAELMREHHFRHVPIVCSEGSVVGLVSHRDVLAASTPNTLPGAEDSKEGQTALSTIMSSPVQTVPENADLRGVAMQLRQQRLGCLPVTRDGAIVGIISDSDFLEVAITLMEQLAMGEPEENY